MNIPEAYIVVSGIVATSLVFSTVVTLVLEKTEEYI